MEWNDHPHPSEEACLQSIAAVRDALDVLSGKWKLPLIIALTNGAKRFKELERALDGITPKILSKELKQLELNEFIERKVYDTTPVTVTYSLKPYSKSLGPVLEELRIWGAQHRKHIVEQYKQERKAEAMKVEG
ncbi:winged helix-turn-helix transcriptional regulator [Chitinophagaceae bacterium MMS25-I14]